MQTVAVADLPKLVGQELGASKWVEISQDMINRYADLSGDHQWIHVDVERAKREIGGTIAHGFLTVMLMSEMMHEIVDITGYKRSLNYGFDKLRFTGVVPAGSRIRMRATLKSVEHRPEGVRVMRECTIDVEGQPRPALVAEWIALLVV